MLEGVLANEITEITRRAIRDYLNVSQTDWSGRFEEPEFLSRLYNLGSMPSTDPRYSDASADIYQHRVNWANDWPADWVFDDSRFDLMNTTDDNFLKFLCETAHPAVRPDAEESRALVRAYNKELGSDGFALVEVSQISGRPVFGAQRAGTRIYLFEEPIGWPKVDRQLQEIRLRLETATTEEHFQTVGLLCREALISAAQAVFDPTKHRSHDPVAPSETDAKRMLDAVLASELSGPANEEARAHAKAATRLALALQHKRSADFRTAALCSEATVSSVNILAILAGRRTRLH